MSQIEFNSLSLAPADAAAEIVPEMPAQIIPLAAHERFYKLTAEEQMRISLLLKLFEEIESAPEGVVATCRRIALENTERGFSCGNLKALYYAWKSTKRDWRVLIRRYGNTSALPDAFCEYVKKVSEQNQRGTRQALLAIRSDWAAGAEIPGYGTWRDFYLAQYPDRDAPTQWPIGFYPPGWSQSNLYTKQSSKASRTLKRRGFAAAKRYLPHVMRDMSQLRFLELIVIDDFETDVIVLARHPVSARYELCTCTGLLAIDGATRTIVGFGLKPRFKSDDGVRIAITRADVQQLLYSVFSEHGLPTGYGVTILAENAAAAISGDFALALETLLGVQVARIGVLADKTLKNGFVQRGGKPWEHGWIEATFNLAHNMAAAMPGQKGASYPLKPGDLEAKILFAEKLLSIDGLAPEVIAQLKVPFLPFDQALEGYTRIFRAMERRTRHKLQGFTEIVDFRLPDGSEIVPETALAKLARDQVMLCTPEPRMESPVERKERLVRGVEFVKVADYALALLLLTPKRCELRNHKISFAHLTQSFTFADADSAVMALAEGTELLGYFDGAGSSVLHCTHLDGRYIGPVKRRGAVDIRNQDALGIEAGEVTRLITKLVLNPVRERHADENARLVADDAHNLKVLRAAGVAEADIPARLLPAARTTLPQGKPDGSAHNALALDATTTTPQRAPAAISLSAKLARPAQSAGEAVRRQITRDTLARAVATQSTAQATEAETAKTLADADDTDLPTL